MNRWNEIWNSRETQRIDNDRNMTETFLYLKKQMGIINYQGKNTGVEQFMNQFEANIAKMSASPSAIISERKKSFFEVGCGSGAYLYYLSCQYGATYIGGIDFSSPLIEAARSALTSQLAKSEVKELYCAEAIELDTVEKYDYVYSRSVFQYFPDEKYGLCVAEKMIEKAKECIGIFDLFDPTKRDAFLAYRRSMIDNYDKIYADTPHQFYPKEMFLSLAKTYNCDVMFSRDPLPGYWNEPFVYDVYLFKRK